MTSKKQKHLVKQKAQPLGDLGGQKINETTNGNKLLPHPASPKGRSKNGQINFCGSSSVKRLMGAG